MQEIKILYKFEICKILEFGPLLDPFNKYYDEHFIKTALK